MVVPYHSNIKLKDKSENDRFIGRLGGKNGHNCYKFIW